MYGYKPPIIDMISSINPSVKPVSLQFNDKGVMWDCVKGLTEVKVDEISYSSRMHKHSHSVVEGHHISEAMLAVTDRLPLVWK